MLYVRAQQIWKPLLIGPAVAVAAWGSRGGVARSSGRVPRLRGIVFMVVAGSWLSACGAGYVLARGIGGEHQRALAAAAGAQFPSALATATTPPDTTTLFK